MHEHTIQQVSYLIHIDLEIGDLKQSKNIKQVIYGIKRRNRKKRFSEKGSEGGTL